MRILRILLLTAVTTFIFACGTDSDSSGSQANSPRSPDAGQSGSGGREQTILETSQAALEAVEESVDEPAAPTAPEDNIVLAATETTSQNTSGRDWQYSSNSHFTKLTTSQGTSSPPDQIEVAEVFWYGCPHCYNFDPYVKKWASELPDDVNFVRIPVIWNPTNQIHARVFYTAEALGKLDEMHEEIFREIHINKQTLATEASIQVLFESYDVSEEDFKNTFRSFVVESKLKRAKNLTQRYRIQSVPILVTNGKYLTEGSGIKNFDDMLSVTDELVDRERLEL